MEDKFVIDSDPKRSNWECELFGLNGEIVVNPVKEPNWFWRLMQYLLVGNKWKIK